MVEAQVVGRLSHPNIAAIHDAKEEGDSAFIVMELVEGRTLQELMERGEGDLRSRVEQLEKIARAVDYAHGRGVVHRDIKPSNILVDAKGEPHLVDFGLARMADRETVLTKSGVSLGTPVYMPPEQVRGSLAEIGPRSDVYSLGVVLYQVLTGT